LSKDLFTFSIQEAETLGIECAIVLAAAKEINTTSSDPSEISGFLKDRLVFLGEEEILMQVKRLIDLKLISSKPISNNESLNRKKVYKLKLPGNNSVAGKRKLNQSWTPSIQAFEVLGMGNINQNFIESKVNEFKMYWLEKNQLRDNWNVLFVDFIRREWVKENSNNKGLPVCIDDDWKPSTDAFDILELANVSKNDALKHLKEFILYWKENGTALRSWNSKFVDFVKRKELIGSYEEKNDKKNNRHNEPGEFSQKFSERTKDDSWAENFEI
jgi:hypothetical protein